MELKGTTHMATPFMAGREKTEEFEKTIKKLKSRIDPHAKPGTKMASYGEFFMEFCMESENVTAKAGTKPVKFMPHKIMVPMKIAMFILPFGDKPIRLC